MGEYPTDKEVNLTGFTRRRITSTEWELLIYLHGDDARRVRQPYVNVLNGYVEIGPNDRRSCLAVDDQEIYVLIHGSDVMSLVHEFGHAIHALKYPNSLNEWPLWKSEAWAELSAMRAIRLKDGLTLPTRNAIARHIWATRSQGFPEHRQGLRVAWRASRVSDKLAEQQEYIVNAASP